MILGTFGGIFGAIYISVNHRINLMFRKKLLKTKLTKIGECLLLTFFTISAFYWAPQLTITDCLVIPGGIPDDIKFNLR